MWKNIFLFWILSGFCLDVRKVIIVAIVNFLHYLLHHLRGALPRNNTTQYNVTVKEGSSSLVKKREAALDGDQTIPDKWIALLFWILVTT